MSPVISQKRFEIVMKSLKSDLRSISMNQIRHTRIKLRTYAFLYSKWNHIYNETLMHTDTQTHTHTHTHTYTHTYIYIYIYIYKQEIYNCTSWRMALALKNLQALICH